jgi:hypothetical protein
MRGEKQGRRKHTDLGPWGCRRQEIYRKQRKQRRGEKQGRRKQAVAGRGGAAASPTRGAAAARAFIPYSPPASALSPPAHAYSYASPYPLHRTRLARLRAAWAPRNRHKAPPRRPERLGAHLPPSPGGRAWPSD